MITPAQIRGAVGQALDGVPATVVAAGTVDGIPPLPAVVVGMPTWDHQGGGTFCLDEWTVPVAVVVAAAGTSPAAELAALEELWPAVADQLVEASQTDQTLGGTVANMSVKGAEFGTFTIQGKDFPCQIVNLSIAG